MPVLTSPPLIGGAANPVSGRVAIVPTATYEWDGQTVTMAPQAGVVRDGLFYDADGTSPLDLVPTPEGVGMRVVLMLASQSTGRGEHRWSRTVTVPDTAEVAWPDLVDVVAPASGGRDYVVPSWAVETLAARDEAVAAKEAAVAVGTSNDAVIAARIADKGSATATALTAAMRAREPMVDARDYGASTAASWQVNRDAINAAVDEAAAAGGGVVLLPPGDLLVKGIVQKSFVDIRFQGTRLIHPDGLTGHIIATQVRYTTGTIATGSDTITLASTAGVHVGTVLAIRGAAGQSRVQASALVGSVNSTQTTGITLASTAGFFLGAGYVTVGAEIIQYTSIVGSTLSGVTRGALGTTPAAHAAGTWIGTSARLYARVISVSGSTVVLDRTAPLGVTDVAVDVGATAPRLSGVADFYGNRPDGGAAANPYPIAWVGVGGGSIEAIDADQCEAALSLQNGTTGCTIGPITANECGNAPVKGSAVWLFRGVSSNSFAPITVTGVDTYTGLYIDDRTSTGSEYDGPCNDNQVAGLSVIRPHAGTADPLDGFALNITGGARNVVGNLIARGVRTPIVVSATSQAYRPDGSPGPDTWGNVVLGGALSQCFRPWNVTAPGSTIGFVYWESMSGSAGYTEYPVALIGTSPTSGALPELGRFTDGTMSAPSIGFTSDPDTGLYRVTENDIGIALGGTWKVRFRPGDVMIRDGINLALGDVAGTRIGVGATQKIGFWGKVPAAQPAAIPDTTSGAVATVEAELNKVKAALRSIGLIG